MNISESKTTIHSFMVAVRDYRLASNTEISTYAVKHAFSELTQGRKTALVQRMERSFKKPIEVIASRIVQKEKPLKKDKRHGYEGIDYKNLVLLDKILDPKLNSDFSKKETYKIAVLNGKMFAVLNCDVHGESLHRAYPCRKKGEDEVSAWAGYCQMCKIRLQNSRMDLAHQKLQDMIDLKDKFLEHIAQNNQTAN